MINLDDIQLNKLGETKIYDKYAEKHMDIAVIGMSLKTAQAEDINEFWDVVKEGKDCITTFPENRKKDCNSYIQLRGVPKDSASYSVGSYFERIDEFDYSFFNIPPKEASLMNPNQRMFLQCVWKAIEDSGYGGERLKGSNTGVYIGHNMGTFVDAMYDYSSFIPQIDPASTPMAIAGNLPSIIASRISYLLDFRGPCISLDTACSSSLVAIHYACQDLKNNKCDVAIAGGVKINFFPLEREYKMGIESSDGKAKTFDDSSDGTGRGEGVAAIILKPLKEAIRDQDYIYAVMKGSAVDQDGSSIGITAPNAIAQENVIIKAWEDAKIDPRTVSYIEAHGTGTMLGDPIEIEGIKRAFGHYTDKKQFCALGAVKTNIGHLDNAAGIVGFIKCVLALKNKQIPPIVNFNYPNKKIDFADSPAYVNIKLMEWENDNSPRRCGINSFGLSGTNCHIVMEEAPERTIKNMVVLKRHVLSISAKSKTALQELILAYHRFIEGDKAGSLASLCYTANTGRAHYEYRLAIIAEDMKGLNKRINRILNDGIEINNREHGIFYKQITEEEKIDVSGLYDSHYMAYMKNYHNAEKLCEWYVRVKNFNWMKIYKNMSYPKLSIPSYRFDRKRCWLELPKEFECNTLNMTQIPSLLPARTVKYNTTADRETSEIEKKIAGIWGNTLGYQELNETDSFVSLGGDSIVALKVTNEVNDMFMIESRVVDILRTPILKDYADNLMQNFLRQRQINKKDQILKVEKADYYPVSHSEKMIFIQEQFNNIGSTYNIPVALYVHGKLDLLKVKESFEKVVAYNEALRTTFVYHDGMIVQMVADACKLDFQVYEVSDQVELSSYVKPFDLAKAPLFRVIVLKKSDEDNVIILDIHHIIADGMSINIILKEFIDLYEDRDVAESQIQYKDFAVWQCKSLQQGRLKQQEAYWKEKLSGDLPKLKMPLDYPRGEDRDFSGKTIEFCISKELTERLERLANSFDMTLNNVLFAVYAMLLKKYTNQEEVIIGLVTSGRFDYQLLKTVGMFNNFLPVRVKCKNNVPFSKILKSINDELLTVYTHQDYPYEAVLELLGIQTEKSRNPLFDTAYIFHNEFDRELNFKGDYLSYEIKQINSGTSKLDLKLDTFLNDELGLTCMLEYSSALFQQETMVRFGKDFQSLIEIILNSPEITAQDIAIFTEKEQLLLENRRRLNEEGKAEKVVVTSTFTAEPVSDYIVWWLKEFGIHTNIEFTAYNQVFQELLDAESSTSMNEGINILLVRFEDWIRNSSGNISELCDVLESSFSELLTILKNKKKNTSYVTVVFPVSTHLKLNYKVVECIHVLNRRWKAELNRMERVYAVDLTESDNVYKVEDIFDATRDSMGHIPFTDEFYAVLGTQIARKVHAVYRESNFKVIVLDADQTLWEGICGEVGAKGVKLREPFLKLQQFMLDRYKEGMLLALCSKNNEDDLWDVFENNPGMILKKEHFVVWRINWGSKSENIREMVEELGLGADSFIFLDDSSTECAEVVANCPEVLTLKLPDETSMYPLFLEQAWCFDKLNITKEDRKRSQMYIAEKKRKEVQDGTKSMEGFLKELNLTMVIHDIEENELSRASQLTIRTNQFNLSTIRRSEDELKSLLKRPEVRCLTVDVADRFGEYGMVGLIIWMKEDDKIFLDTFIMSCRVLGRGIEDAILEYIAKECEKNGTYSLEADFIETQKNKPFREFLERTQWNAIHDEKDRIRMKFDLKKRELRTDYITILKDRKETGKKNATPGAKKMQGVLDHAAVAVKSIKNAKKFFESMGYTCSNEVEDNLQNARLIMCCKSGHVSLELVAPVDEASPSYRLVEENGEHIYHLCYRVESIAGYMHYLNEYHMEYEVISNSKPAILFNNRNVCFINVKGCGLIELVEYEKLENEISIPYDDHRDVISLVTNSLNDGVAFFQTLDYFVIKNGKDEDNNGEVILFHNTNESIRLLSPQSKSGKYFEQLKEKGVYIHNLAIKKKSIQDLEEVLKENEYAYTVEDGSEKRDEVKVIKLKNRRYLYYYTEMQKKEQKDSECWKLDIPNYDRIKHYRYLLPLQYHTGKMLLKLPVYELSENNVIKAPYVPPRNEAERRITKVWEEVLSVDRIGINDNFFELGGNSIKGVQIVSKLTRDFEIHLNDIFKYNTIAVLAQNAPFKENHFKGNLKKMKNTAVKNQDREYTDDAICIKKYEDYLADIKKYDEYDYDKESSYKDILFLGATGYLGSHIFERLLKQTNSNFHVIVRGGSHEEAKKRLKDILSFYFDRDLLKEYEDRINIVAGDFSKECFGIEENRYEELSELTDCVFNSAANVKHYGKFDTFYESNVLGIKRIIEFAQNKKQKPIHHISTLNVAHGKVKDVDNFVFTEFDHDIGQLEENFYIKTKLEGEKLLVFARQEGIDINIYRVGNLVFNTETGKFQQNIADNAFYTLIKSFIHIKRVPGLKRDVLDFSFVDHASKAVTLLFCKSALRNETFHIFNHNRLSFAKLGEYLKNIEQDIDVSGMDVFFDYLYDNFDNPQVKEHILNILVHGYIMGDINDTNFYIMADKTNKILRNLGFNWTEIHLQEVKTLVDYGRKVNFI